MHAHHEREAAIARDIYIRSLATDVAAIDWYRANAAARVTVFKALRDTGMLRNVEDGVFENAGHLKVLRHILAPPMSQDQFALFCPGYNKLAENNARPMTRSTAAAVAAAINAARSRHLARWLDYGRSPRPIEIKELIRSITPMLSQQIVATLRRNRLAAQQEREVIDLLEAKGWTRQRSQIVEGRTDVLARHFMHKTRFATRTRPQEVDIACGLGKTVVLAMECKVTNDQTNSVKRVNDILKKAKAWQDHWASFVKTAALLQGVVAYSDVHRLLDADIEVFWSHRLQDFEAWIDANTSP